MIIVVLVFLTQNIYANTHAHNKIARKQPNKILCITIPKCGTNLLKKCLALIDPERKAHYSGKFDIQKLIQQRMKSNKNPQPPHHFKGKYYIPVVGELPHWLVNFVNKNHEDISHEHWPYTKKSADFLYQNTKANFFLIRDPRDHIVSMAYFLQNGLDGQSASINDLIFDFIDGRQKHYISWGVFINDAYPLIWELGVADFYKMYLPWMQARGFCTIKFENLVGPHGGGTKEAQLLEIAKIASHIKKQITIEKIESVAHALFGQSITFREGKIGSWKSHFTPEMKQAFKNAPGAAQLLIDLGYEKDMNW